MGLGRLGLKKALELQVLFLLLQQEVALCTPFLVMSGWTGHSSTRCLIGWHQYLYSTAMDQLEALTELSRVLESGYDSSHPWRHMGQNLNTKPAPTWV